MIDLVILSTTTLAGHDLGEARRRAQWTRQALARRGRVLYVSAVETTHHNSSDVETSRPDLSDDGAFDQQAFNRNLSTMSLYDLGFDEFTQRRAWFGLDPGNLAEFKAAFARALAAFDHPTAERRVALFTDPFVPFALLLPELARRGYRLVYDCLDDFEAMAALGYYFESACAERYLIQESDLTLVVTPTLRDKLAARYPDADLRVLRQGYEPAAFAPPPEGAPLPSDLVRGVVTLGYWGLVNDLNIDVALVEFLARARPDWSIVLIGPVDAEAARVQVGDRLRALPNVHLLGPKAHAELVRYLAGFDVALVPFPDHPFNRARDPLKVKEYLAGGKPVVAAHAPQVAEMPYVYSAETPAEFLDAVEQARRTPVNRAELDAYLAQNTWSARFDVLCSWVDALPRRERTVRELAPADCYGSDGIAPNVRAYVAEMEKLLAERTRFVEELERSGKETRRYVERLERTHPGVWLRRLLKRG